MCIYTYAIFKYVNNLVFVNMIFIFIDNWWKNNRYFLQESHLTILLNKWNINGTWIGQELGLKSLNLCPLQEFPDKIRFASEYYVTCSVNAKELLGKGEPIFYDVYLKYTSNNETILHSIPLLIQNYKHHKKFVNKVM